MPEIFYGIYYIDPSAMACGSIIQVDCDGLHSYVNPCDLIEECLLHIPQQLTKQCVVDFFNTTIDTIPAWYVLRVNASHCLEAVPLVINDTDEKVWVSSTDTPWYLWAKIVGSTVNGRVVNVNIIWSMWNQQVQIAIAPPTGVVIVPSTPTCNWAFLKWDANWNTYRDCNGGDQGLRAVRYASNDLQPSLVTNMYQSFLFTNSAARGGINLTFTPSMDVFQWSPWMNWTNTYDGMIRIEKSGMYEIRMKGEAVINNWVSRIRLFVCVPKATNPKILIDAKYWAEETFAWSYANAPYQSNAWADGLKSMTVTLNGHSLVWLDADTYIALGCKIDSRWTDWVTPTVSFRCSVYDLQPVWVGQSNSEVSYAWPWISFWVMFYSNHKH
jgi:hypothetical protein